jgi:hypothetical protein
MLVQMGYSNRTVNFVNKDILDYQGNQKLVFDVFQVVLNQNVILVSEVILFDLIDFFIKKFLILKISPNIRIKREYRLYIVS